MSFFLQFLIAGAVAGSLYAIVASSLVVTYTTSGVFNFAQGGTAFLVALVFYELNSGLGWPVVPSALVAIVVFAPVLGWVLDRLVFRRLADASETAKIVATVALGVALPAIGIFAVDRGINLLHWDLVSADNVVTPPGLGPTPPEFLNLSDTVTISTNQLASLAAATFSAVALWLVIRHTRLGLRMRAVVDRRDLVALRGVDPERTSAAAWMLSTMLAGLAGVVAAPILALGPASFTLLMLVGATAAVFGRLRSIPMAYAAGLGLGVVQNLFAGYVDPEIDVRGLSSALPYVLLFLGLVLLLTDRRREGGTIADESPTAGVLDDERKLSRGVGWGLAVVALVVFTLFVADELWVGLVVAGLSLGVVFLSFTVVTGVGGMVSLAQATFVTAAGMTAGLLLSHDVPYLLALLAGVAVSAVVGSAVALPALRLGGVALGLATFALAFIADLVVFQIDDVRNGSAGWLVSRPELGPFDFSSDKSLAMLVLAVALGVVWLIRGLQRSPSGRAAMALRSSPTGAAASGISPITVRLGLFAVSGALAGLGGVLYVTYQGFISSFDFPPMIGLIWLAVVVLFGVRRPAFAIVAGLAFAALPQILSDYFTTSSVVPDILFGLGAIGLAQSPDGWMSDAGTAIARVWRKRRSPPPIEPRPQDMPPEAAPHEAEIAATLGAPEPVASGHPVPARPGGAEPLLVLSGIRAGYGEVEVLHGIDLAVSSASIVAVLGANGAGKSTLAAVMAGSLVPTTGDVLLDGNDITRVLAHRRARTGLLLAPEARGVFPALSVDENLRLVLDDDGCARAYARFPLLGERRRTAAGGLSGGEQQMLALAPLLVDPPRLLIADEPSLGLAPLVVEEVFQLLAELREEGVGLVVIEEKMRDVLPIADQVVVLDLGRVVWAGPPHEGDAERLAATYLGVASEAKSPVST